VKEALASAALGDESGYSTPELADDDIAEDATPLAAEPLTPLADAESLTEDTPVASLANVAQPSLAIVAHPSSSSTAIVSAPPVFRGDVESIEQEQEIVSQRFRACTDGIMQFCKVAADGEGVLRKSEAAIKVLGDLGHKTWRRRRIREDATRMGEGRWQTSSTRRVYHSATFQVFIGMLFISF
jgi:hypothetical protein